MCNHGISYVIHLIDQIAYACYIHDHECATFCGGHGLMRYWYIGGVGIIHDYVIDRTMKKEP